MIQLKLKEKIQCPYCEGNLIDDLTVTFGRVQCRNYCSTEGYYNLIAYYHRNKLDSLWAKLDDRYWGDFDDASNTITISVMTPRVTSHIPYLHKLYTMNYNGECNNMTELISYMRELCKRLNELKSFV